MPLQVPRPAARCERVSREPDRVQCPECMRFVARAPIAHTPGLPVAHVVVWAKSALGQPCHERPVTFAVTREARLDDDSMWDLS